MKRIGRLACVAIVVLAACGGSDTASTPDTGDDVTTTTVAAAPKGPPTATFTLEGDAGLAGDVTQTSISCSNPTFDGIVISVGGVPAGGAADAPTVLIGLSTGKVTVRISRGSSSTFETREFSGTGLVGFDGATGGKVNGPLTDVTAAGLNKGTLGAVTAIKGVVDCGTFAAGTANVKVTGDTADGAVDAVLDPVLVTCSTTPQGNAAIVRGIVTVGSTKAMFFVTTQPDTTLTVFETVQGAAAQRQYMGPAGSGTPTTNGTTIKGDAIEQNATPPHTLHIEGNATCGTNGK